jgi:hypothetical protein
MRNGAAITPFVDPELGAMAGKFAGEGLHIPDPTVAPLAEVRRAHIRLGQYLSNMTKPRPVEREITLEGPHGIFQRGCTATTRIRQGPCWCISMAAVSLMGDSTVGT